MKRFALAILPAVALAATPAWSQQQESTQSEVERSLEEMEQKSREAGEAAERAAQPGESQAASSTADPVIVAQEEGQVRADEIIGASVKSGAGADAEEIGSIADLLFDSDNNLTGALIGVGGFLGIGEKQVAVSWDALEKVEQDGNVEFIASVSREQLEQAPAFLTKEEQKAEQERQEQQQSPAGTGQPRGAN